MDAHRIGEDLGLGPAIVLPSANLGGNPKFEAQGDGFAMGRAIEKDGKYTMSGSYVASDDTVATVEVRCCHGFTGITAGVQVPRDAPSPTWVFNVGQTTWAIGL